MNDRTPFGSYLEDIGALPRAAGAGAYILGFILSLGITYGAYEIATHHSLVGGSLMTALAGLALLQFTVQCVCFLHLGPHISRARAAVFFIALGVVIILVGGSVWIMANLGSRMTLDAAHMEQYMQTEDAF